MQNDLNRKAILAAVNKRKQQTRGVEVTEASGPSDTILSRKDFEGMKCWDGYQAKGKKKGKNGKMVNNCVKLSFIGRLTELAEKTDRLNPHATTAALAAPAAVGLGVSIPTLGAVIGNPFGEGHREATSQEKKVYNHIVKNAKKEGIGVHTSSHKYMPGFAWNHSGKEDGVFTQIQKMGIESLTRDNGSKSTRGVAIGENVHPAMKSGVLAHEIGHVSGNPLVHSGWGRGIGRQASGIGALYASAGTSDQNKARNAAIIGTIASAPEMASEIDASVRGHAVLRNAHKATKVKMGVLDHLKPGVGIASYGAVAAAPALAYEVKKHLGGYKQKKDFAFLGRLTELSAWSKTLRKASKG
jgi:hypothetical protein